MAIVDFIVEIIELMLALVIGVLLIHSGFTMTSLHLLLRLLVGLLGLGAIISGIWVFIFYLDRVMI